jgi:hypothetical protein
MRRIGAVSQPWRPPAGIETRVVDEFGNVVPEDCPTATQTHQEYFLMGTTPPGYCFTYDDWYGYPDTLGYDTLGDTLTNREDRWWDRLRDRFRRRDPRRDSLRDTLRVPPDTLRVRRDTILPDTIRRLPPDTIDTLRVRADTVIRRSVVPTVRPDSARVRPIRPRVDTLRLRRDTSLIPRRVRRDTLSG